MNILIKNLYIFKKYLIVLCFSCNLIQVVNAATCSDLMRAYHDGKTAIDHLYSTKKTLVMAHGKNINISNESTWLNLINSIEASDGHLGGLEVDVMITKDKEMVIMHDPTFHILAKDYKTSKKDQKLFKKKYPQIANSKPVSDWDYNLFDEVSFKKLNKIKKKMKIFDESSGLAYDVLTLKDLLLSIEEKQVFKVPKYIPVSLEAPIKKNALEYSMKYSNKETRIKLKNDLVLYLDFKPLNNYVRRLYGLSDWHWIRKLWSLNKLKRFSEESLQVLSKELSKYNGHGKTYIAARHPKIAKMISRIDQKINFMASPDSITQDMSSSELINEFRGFMKYKPKFIEIKYLDHILDRDIRSWAKENNFKIMFNHISEGDISQFEGIYKNNQNQLINDILKDSKNLIIQTNTIKFLQAHLDDTL